MDKLYFRSEIMLPPLVYVPFAHVTYRLGIVQFSALGA
jgi:hypothetical protein